MHHAHKLCRCTMHSILVTVRCHLVIRKVVVSLVARAEVETLMINAITLVLL